MWEKFFLISMELDGRDFKLKMTIKIMIGEIIRERELCCSRFIVGQALLASIFTVL